MDFYHWMCSVKHGKLKLKAPGQKTLTTKCNAMLMKHKIKERSGDGQVGEGIDGGMANSHSPR